MQLDRTILGTAEFRLLGAVDVVVDDRALDLGPISRRTVLAALLIDTGYPVPVDTLAARLWDDMPAAARSSVYANISRLRSTLSGASVAADLRRTPSGYLLSVPPGSVDLGRFNQLVELSHEAQGDEERARLLLQALRLWRGPALAAMTSAWATRVREALAERRVAAAALWAQAEFRLGRPERIPAQLSDLLVEHPLSEPLTFEVIRALAASGRVAEALDSFARLRNRLADQLGAEPGANISQLHLEILRGTFRVPRSLERQRAAVSSAPAPPAQLPRWGTGFIGRDAELSWISKQASGDINVLVITGIGGVGKTSLAVRWSTSVRRQFPDGQLYVDLRGFSSQPPMQAAEVLVQFLRSLGMPAADIPVDPAEAAAQYRSVLADREVLVLLDNAENASQVRPLLPAAPGCMVVVTSRNKLTGLVARDAARRLELDVLSADSAIELLRNDLSTYDYGDRDALARLAAACGYLPLALRVAAARVSELPSRALGDYTRALQGGDRIGVLAISGDAEASVEARFRAVLPRPVCAR